jgi:catechol 2,3-dioxygenase-like lactoylglutathione lyase family enzyme
VIRRMDHFTIVSDQLDKTLAFYSMLGLSTGPRPDFGVPGFWFYVGDHPVLHVLGVDRMPEPRRGTLDHMAFWAEGLIETVERLREDRVQFSIIRTPRPYSTWQVFFDDPNGAEVELDFDAAERAPADWKAYVGRSSR